ncbi:MAG TPA: response regulator transcription factor [Acidimicrobiales bacterium]|nr:response regulator transcription factor [Acidimicrobiales bacterium]
MADDAVLLREGLVRILAEDDLEVVGAVGDVDALLACVDHTRPDLAIIDVRMPPTFTDEGVRAAREIRERYPTMGVLLLSQHVHAGGALRLFDSDAGGLGYLLKDRVLEIDEFLSAVRRVGTGGTAVDPLVIAALVRRGAPDTPLAVLSDREREVLSMMAEGLSNAAIAERLVVGQRTVETHINSIFTKLGLLPTAVEHRRVRAVVTYLQSRST